MLAKVAMSHRTALLTVKDGDWGATSLKEIHAVLESVCGVLVEAFGKEPDYPVRVSPWSRKYALAVYDQRPYQIFLTARDTYWCQYVYQFSHELCHILTNFDRHRGHRHKWFEECLCEMSSLFVLHRLAQVWTENPPPDILGAPVFAPNHRTYAEEIKTKYRKPPVAGLSGWLAENIRTLEECPVRSKLNGMMAVALLDRFRDEPSLWCDCSWLNHWNPSSDATFSDYLDSWSNCLCGNNFGNRTPPIVKKLVC